MMGNERVKTGKYWGKLWAAKGTQTARRGAPGGLFQPTDHTGLHRNQIRPFP